MKLISLRKKNKGQRDWGRNWERKREKEKEWEWEIGRGRRCQKTWKDQCDVIEELLEDEERVKGLLRHCLFLLLCLGFSFCTLSFLWFCWVLVSPWSQLARDHKQGIIKDNIFMVLLGKFWNGFWLNFINFVFVLHYHFSNYNICVV